MSNRSLERILTQKKAAMEKSILLNPKKRDGYIEMLAKKRDIERLGELYQQSRRGISSYSAYNKLMKETQEKWSRKDFRLW